jgi:hypothetical protein
VDGAIDEVDVSILAANRGDVLSVSVAVQRRRGAEIPVMNVMRDGLIVPIKSGSKFQRSAVGVQRKERVGIEIVSGSHAPV